MKRFDIRICGNNPNIAEALLKVALTYEKGSEQHKRQLGELFYAVLHSVDVPCSLSVPAQGLDKENRRLLMNMIAAIAGTDQWELLTDKLDKHIFSVRELQIIPMICNKLTDPQIAALTRLKLSYVREIHKSIYEKTGVHSKDELIAFIQNPAAEFLRLKVEIRPLS